MPAATPVISHYDTNNGDLRLTHCGDQACIARSDQHRSTRVEHADDVGQYTSLELDDQGFPVISYFDVTNGDLKVAHCNDANCAGGDEPGPVDDAAPEPACTRRWRSTTASRSSATTTSTLPSSCWPSAMMQLCRR